MARLPASGSPAVPRPGPGRARLEPAQGSGQGFWALAWYRFRHHKVALAGAAIVLGLVLVTLLAGPIAPYRFEDIDLTASLRSPSWSHLLGTDPIAPDAFTRRPYAARVRLPVAFPRPGPP